jgi:hypothetical protein
MTKFLITDIVSRASTIVCLEEASRITELDPDEILWALEEEGICETDRYVVADFAEPSVAACNALPELSGFPRLSRSS